MESPAFLALTDMIKRVVGYDIIEDFPELLINGGISFDKQESFHAPQG